LEDYERRSEMERTIVTDKTLEVTDLHRERAIDLFALCVDALDSQEGRKPITVAVGRIAKTLAEWEEAQLEWLQENGLVKEE